VESKFTQTLSEFKKNYKEKYTNDVLQEYEVNRYAKFINDYQESHKISDKQHIKNVKRKKNDISNNICPRCGAKLIIVNTDKGDRYRCSNDGCDFMMKIK